MANSIEFVKLSGSGNDFLCIDNRDGRFDDMLCQAEAVASFSHRLCSRGMGLGADGVIFACANDVDGFSDLAARFFEADGSEAELCGNGTACFIHWATANGWVPDDRDAKILTPAGVVRGTNSDGRYVRVCIPDPEDVELDFKLDVAGRNWQCDYALTGVPHVIAYVDNVDEMEITHWGPALRYHDRFAPRGANANFVQVLHPGELAVRTWEFGVEGETLACGTGSAAAAIMAAVRFNWPACYLDGTKAVQIRVRSGDILKVQFVRRDDGTVTDVCLETIVRFLCYGSVHPDLAEICLQDQPTRRTDRN